MNNLDEIKKLVAELNEEDLGAFSKWFEEHLADRWDEQIERDAKAGKLDKLIEQARADHRAGRTRPL